MSVSRREVLGLGKLLDGKFKFARMADSSPAPTPEVKAEQTWGEFAAKKLAEAEKKQSRAMFVADSGVGRGLYVSINTQREPFALVFVTNSSKTDGVISNGDRHFAVVLQDREPVAVVARNRETPKGYLDTWSLVWDNSKDPQDSEELGMLHLIQDAKLFDSRKEAWHGKFPDVQAVLNLVNPLASNIPQGVT